MKNKLTDLFKSKEIEEKRFNSIKITLASPEMIKSWSFGEKMVFFVQEFLDLLKTMNVYVVNTNV